MFAKIGFTPNAPKFLWKPFNKNVSKNTEIPLIEDSENLEDELFKLARLKLVKNSVIQQSRYFISVPE